MSKTANFSLSNLTEEGTAKTDETSPGEVRAFELNELVTSGTSHHRKFTYDSETARNFDDSNVKKAKEGVKELMADAIARAKVKSTEIKEQAQKEGYDSGHSEGFKKGEDEAKTEFSPFLETIEKLIRDLSEYRKNMYPKVEREMVEMVLNLAKKVIHFELSTREDSVQEMIRLAVQSVLDKETMTIKINPADKGYAESFRPELHHLFGEIKNITFEAHSGIERGGCLIETNFGTVDARIEKLDEQIDKILNMAPPPVEEEPSPAEEEPSPAEEEPSPVEEEPPPAEEEPPPAQPE